MKKRAKKLLAIILTAVMTLTAIPLSGLAGIELPDLKELFTTKAEAATSYTEGIYTYAVTNGEATITDCDENASGAITIPSTLGGYPVTSIGDDAFSYCSSLTSIDIPDSVLNIGYSAFSDCSNLTSIDIPDSVLTIGDYAFSSCPSLTGIDIPDSVLSIGYRTFSWCSSLTSIDVSENNKLYSSSEGVLFNKNKTELIQYPIGNSRTNYSIPTSVLKIVFYAFSTCKNLTSINIPKNVLSIGESAFSWCSNLTNVSFDDDSQLTSIGDSVFSDCSSLTSVNIPDSLLSIGNYAFNKCNSLTSIDIPDSVSSIGSYAFFNCSSLTSIDIPDNVLSIGGNAFSSCSRLTSIDIPNSVLSIGGYAFSRCSKLTSIDIPDSVLSIGSYAFSLCKNLTIINVSENNKFYSSYEGVLFNKNKTKLIQYPIGNSKANYSIPIDVLHIGDSAFSGCSNLTSIDIPDSVLSIGNSAFSGCSNLTSIDIPDSVLSIGSWAFSSCSNLTSIDIPDSIFSIGDSAFNNTEYYNNNNNWVDDVLYIDNHLIEVNSTSLNTYSVRTGTKSIGNSAFSDCSGLTSIDIPDSVLSIGDYAFSGCSNLTVINIPDSVLSIGDSAFNDTEYYNNSENWVDGVLYIGNHLIGVNSTSLNTYSVRPGTKSIGNSAFSHCSSLTSIDIPDSLLRIGDSAFSWCSKLTSIDIPDNVLSIGDSAFSNCSSLTSIDIPDSVLSIGDYAFSWCKNLTNIDIPDSVLSIGGYALFNCSSLTNINTSENNKFYSSSDGVLFNKNKTTLIQYPTGNSRANYSIPIGVINIGDWAFTGCSNLTSIDIPDSVINIGLLAFSWCSNLTSVDIPDSVLSIGDSAFSGCFKLTSVDISGNVLSIGDSTFSTCSSLTSINIPDSVLNIGSLAFSGCSNLTSINIPANVLSIGHSAFSSCSSITNIDIPDSVLSIGVDAFSGCSSLTNINVSENNKFYSSSEGVLFNKSKTKLTQYPKGSSKINYSIPIGVLNIGVSAFYGCSNLTTIDIPDSVLSIGDSAFWACDGLSDVYYSGTEEEWNKIIIGSNNDELLNATIHFNSGGDPHEHSYTATGEYQSEHPHYSIYRCSCGDEFNTEKTNYDEACSICNPHVHDYSIPGGYQTEHPHYKIMKCSCGAEYVTDEESYMPGCAECEENHVHRYTFSHYKTEHPHYWVYKCSCGHEVVAMREKYVASCKTCNPGGDEPIEPPEPPVEDCAHNYVEFYNQSAHPHYTVYQCTLCGDTFTSFEENDDEACKICHPDPTHVHKYTFEYYQTSHPHYWVLKCSCGHRIVAMRTGYLSSCIICNGVEPPQPPVEDNCDHSYEFTGYSSSHPHYSVYECTLCGDTFFGGTNYRADCEDCNRHYHSFTEYVSTQEGHPHYKTYRCSCGETTKYSSYDPACEECNSSHTEHIYTFVGIENAHPHYSIYSCTCGDKFTSFIENHVETCEICKSNPPEDDDCVHSFKLSYIHSSHPHYSVYKCTECGYEFVSSITNTVENCDGCNHTHSYVHAYYQSGHPHYEVRVCSCGSVKVESDPNKLTSCKICYPENRTETDPDTGIIIIIKGGGNLVDIVIDIFRVIDNYILSVFRSLENAIRCEVYNIGITSGGSDLVLTTPITVKIPVPSGYNTETSYVYYYNNVTGKLEIVDATIINGYFVFETTRTGTYGIVEFEEAEKISFFERIFNAILDFLMKIIDFFTKIIESLSNLLA